MGLVNAVYSWPSVKALCLTVFSMNLAGLLAVALAILWAIRFERGFGDYLNLVTPGDGHVWTVVIVSSAICCSPAYILGIKCWLYLKLEPTRNDLEEQNKVNDSVESPDVNRLLFFHVVACLLSGFLVAILNATYLVLLSGFQQKTRDGLMEAIEKYGTDVAAKARIDAVQTELECCGDNSYVDWFRVPWLKLSMEGPEDVKRGPRLEEQAVTEEQEEEFSTPVDVPFSCCSNDIPKPCIHHDILRPSSVYDYNPKHLTIAIRGCRSRIIGRGEVIRIFLAGYLGLLSVYQVVLSLMSRLLQTAHSNALYIGPEQNRYHVWVLFKSENFNDNENESGEHERRKSTRSKRKLAPLLFRSSNEKQAYPEHRKNNRDNRKVLTKHHWKMFTAKSKSLPAVKSTFRPSNSRGKRKITTESEEDIDDDDDGEEKEEEEEEEEEEEPDEEKRLLSRRKTKSEVITRKDRRPLFSLLSSDDDSSTIDLPSPPPPPPPRFVVTLDVESEQERIPYRTVLSKTPEMEANKTSITVYPGGFVAQNSGRRIKVLERFEQIRNEQNRLAPQRECGGADDSNSNSRRSLISNRSSNRIRTEFNAADTYNRFRGTLQHTLARREAARIRRESLNVYRPEAQACAKNVDTRRANVPARLRYNNVPPSYRLLANIEVKERPDFQARLVPPIPPPPPLPLPTPPSKLSTRNSRRILCETKLRRQGQRQCSICNRPVQQSTSSSSRESLAETREGARTRFSTSNRRKASPAAFSRYGEHSNR